MRHAILIAALAALAGPAMAQEPKPGEPSTVELTAACNAALKADDSARLAYMREIQAGAVESAKLKAEVEDLKKQLAEKDKAPPKPAS